MGHARPRSGLPSRLALCVALATLAACGSEKPVTDAAIADAAIADAAIADAALTDALTDDAAIADAALTDAAIADAATDAATPSPDAATDAATPSPDAAVDAAPPVLPSLGFAATSITVGEFALAPTTLALQPTPVAITLVRTGADLTAPASATLTVHPASTAIGQVHFTAEAGSPLTTTGAHVLSFPAAAPGVTAQPITLTIYTRYNREPRGSTRQLALEVTAVTGAAALPTPTARHTTTFVGAGDKAYAGVDIPELVPLGAYAGAEHCESWGPGGLGTPSPGAGGAPPCGSYTIPLGAQLTHPHYGRCNDGMRNDVTNYGGTVGRVTNAVLGVKMFVEEDLKLGSTHFLGNTLTYSHHANDAFIIKFRTGGAGEYTVPPGATPGTIGALQFAFAEHTSQGPPAPRFAVLTTSPCDFNYARLGVDPCYRALGAFDALSAEILPTGTSTTGKCTLRPNTTYYLSMRWEDPSQRGYVSCRPGTTSPFGGYCGTVLGIQ
jgi:hypothetical protein